MNTADTENASAQEVTITRNTQTWLRILIASYFLAVALRIIPGTDFTGLFALVAPAHFAPLLAVVTVFSLAYMVMIGCLTRLSALLLALMTFFAAFLSYISPMGGDLGAFWRDIAMVSALMLTYSRRPPRQAKLPAAPGPKIADLARARAKRGVERPSDLRAPLGAEEVDNIFHDLAEAR